MLKDGGGKGRGSVSERGKKKGVCRNKKSIARLPDCDEVIDREKGERVRNG